MVDGGKAWAWGLTRVRTGRLRRTRRHVFVAAAAALVIALTPETSRAQSTHSQLREVPIAFTVTHPGEGGLARTVRGVLYLPARSSACPGVQLLFQGFSYGKWIWDLPGFPQYSYARAMGRSGYPVVVLDLLGYGDSDRPNGRTITTEGYGVMAHQMVEQLRAGTYQGDLTPAFAKVIIGGHSAGGEVARLEAGTFGDVDGLVVMSMGNNVTQRAAQAFLETNVPMSLASDYVQPFFGDHERRLDFFYQYPTTSQPEEEPFADPDVMAADRRLANPTPSGQIQTMVPQPSAAVVGKIRVPVALVLAERDEIVPVSEAQTERDRYSQAADFTTIVVPRAGHSFSLHRNAQQAFELIRQWLAARPGIAPTCSGSEAG